MNKRTEINQQLSSINLALSKGTVVNPDVAQGPRLSSGTLLNGRYRISAMMSATSGEADLYFCRTQDRQFVAKVYRRENGIKRDVIEKLKGIRSVHIASPLDYGTVGGKFFEILPYFGNGSLEGKRFTLEQLKSFIIPSLLDGLRDLHRNRILHKDLKPSNVMLCDNNRDVSIIDFGISSVRQDGSTMVVTQTGMTPIYTAPEALKGVFLEESDYYSLGITLYELYTGKVPYSGMSAEDIARFVSVQRLPFPADIPDELKVLISALTYSDISNRGDKGNPNRRWKYEEVDKWLRGEEQVVPGVSADSAGVPFLYSFEGKTYRKMADLVAALAYSWEAAKKELFRGLLFKNLYPCDPKSAVQCEKAEAAVREGNISTDRALFELLYQFAPNMRAFCWLGKRYESVFSLGEELMSVLRASERAPLDYYESILANGVLSSFASIVERDNKALIGSLRAIEEAYSGAKADRDRRCLLYRLAYIVSGERSFVHRGKTYFTVEDISGDMKALFSESLEKLTKFCHAMVDGDGRLEPQFEAWLLGLGKSNELDSWRQALAYWEDR